MQEPIAGRRIVSKGAFAVAVAKKMGLGLVAALIGIVTLGGLFSVIVFLLRGVTLPEGGHSPRVLLYFIAPCCLLGFSSALWLRVARDSMKQAIRASNVAPLTRANTADLPALDSLVRASQEPVQVQEGVLLRAASGEAQAGQEGQLLRASVGGQE